MREKIKVAVIISIVVIISAIDCFIIIKKLMVRSNDSSSKYINTEEIKNVKEEVLSIENQEKSAEKEATREACKKIPATDWRLYQNKKLGFELKIPKEVDDGPIKIIEEDDVVWIVPENSDYYATKLKQFNNSSSDFDKVNGIPWAILIKKIKNDEELKGFIEKRYGAGCKLGKIAPTSQPELSDVDVIRTDLEGVCPLNWTYFIKYSSKEHRVAVWDMGQAYNFVKEKNCAVLVSVDVGYDDEMVKSFKFIK